MIVSENISKICIAFVVRICLGVQMRDLTAKRKRKIGKFFEIRLSEPSNKTQNLDRISHCFPKSQKYEKEKKN